MSNLIPEKRMDKNGKLVTKHVKAGHTGDNGGRSVPAPSLTQNRRRDQIHALVRSISFTSIRQYETFLTDCRDSTLDTLTAITAHPNGKYSTMVGNAILRKNEGFLALLGASQETWGSVLESTSMGDLDRISNILWTTYTELDPYGDHSRYAHLDRSRAEDFDQEGLLEAFRPEFLGSMLELNFHSPIKYAYHKSLVRIENEMDEVTEIMPLLLKINSKLSVIDKYGDETRDSLTVDQVLAVVQMKKDYPDRVSLLEDFAKQRRSFDEEAARAFLATEAIALGSGIL